MIELLVALAISSFLILGITQVYLNNKSSYTFQQSQAANMDLSRFLQMILDEQISRAGYRRSPEQELEDAFPTATSTGCAEFPAESAVTKLSDANKVGFCMRYQPAFAGELSCDGVAATLTHEDAFRASKASENITVRIEYEPKDELHEGRLLCNGTELVNGLADFRVEFLVGPKLERRFNDAPYVAAADYSASDGLVRGLRYEALFAGATNQRVGSNSPILDSWLASMTANAKKRLEDNDKGRIYQATSSTQLLRNLVP